MNSLTSQNPNSFIYFHVTGQHLELLGQRLEARSQLNEADLLKISDAHARKMVALIQAGYYHARAALSRDYPDVDLSVIDAAFNDGMDTAVAALEAEAADE